ncbi:Disease resistance protein RPP8 [Acorus calamus]|uniref:Disease resistance protein RPP8 n=1 Tax=Acorus calamus TaxID=4465 RepID=A0AAV9EVI3_ACOCL|nr:Disease resistance protein RPP8 [Acorus calamus]
MTSPYDLRLLAERKVGSFSGGSIPSNERKVRPKLRRDVGDTQVYLESNVIEKMQELRHLYSLYGFHNKNSLTGALGRLTNLQTLSTVYAGEWVKVDLPKLTSLRRLKLRNRVEGLLERLPDIHGFPPALVKLTLIKSQLERLPNLRKLHLNARSHLGKRMVCTMGGFPRLESLILAQLQELEEWVVEGGAMPRLGRLTILACQEMKSLPDGLRYLKTLREFELYYISPAFKDGVRKCAGGEWEKIKHIPSLKIG